MEKDLSEVGHTTHVHQIAFNFGHAMRVYTEVCPCCGKAVVRDGPVSFDIAKWPYIQGNGQ